MPWHNFLKTASIKFSEIISNCNLTLKSVSFFQPVNLVSQRCNFKMPPTFNKVCCTVLFCFKLHFNEIILTNMIKWFWNHVRKERFEQTGILIIKLQILIAKDGLEWRFPSLCFLKKSKSMIVKECSSQPMSNI